MTPNRDEMRQLRERVAKLTREEQLLLAEDILRTIRKEHFTDHEAYYRALREDFEALRAREAAEQAASEAAGVTPSGPEATRAAG